MRRKVSWLCKFKSWKKKSQSLKPRGLMCYTSSIYLFLSPPPYPFFQDLLFSVLRITIQHTKCFKCFLLSVSWECMLHEIRNFAWFGQLLSKPISSLQYMVSTQRIPFKWRNEQNSRICSYFSLLLYTTSASFPVLPRLPNVLYSHVVPVVSCHCVFPTLSPRMWHVFLHTPDSHNTCTQPSSSTPYSIFRQQVS